MIKKEEMYTVYCNHCREQYYDYDLNLTHFSDELHISKTISEANWYINKKYDEHYCPKCYQYNENGEIYLHKKREAYIDKNIYNLLDIFEYKYKYDILFCTNKSGSYINIHQREFNGSDDKPILFFRHENFENVIEKGLICLRNIENKKKKSKNKK